MHFYLGLGPSVSYAYSHSTFNDVTPESRESYVLSSVGSSSSSQWGVGGYGSAGVEWFAVKWLSIRSEYSMNVQYQWRSNSSNQDNTSSPPTIVPSHYVSSGSSKGWLLSNPGVSFGLNVYWQ